MEFPSTPLPLKDRVTNHPKVRTLLFALSMTLILGADHDAPNCGKHAFVDGGRILIPHQYEEMGRSMHFDGKLQFPSMSHAPSKPDFYMHSYYAGNNPQGEYYPIYPAFDMNGVLKKDKTIRHLDEVSIIGLVKTCDYPRGTEYVEATNIEKIERYPLSP